VRFFAPRPDASAGIDLAALAAMTTPPPRQIAKWCAYALALAAPGSFVVLPLWLLRRHWMSRNAWLTRQSRSARRCQEP
jgi:hypothetical protein